LIVAVNKLVGRWGKLIERVVSNKISNRYGKDGEVGE